jgi:hypothetical protein
LGLFLEHWQKSRTQNAHRIPAISPDEIRNFKLAMSLSFPAQFGTLGRPAIHADFQSILSGLKAAQNSQQSPNQQHAIHT